MNKIRKLVIPVAGRGTRFLPITKAVPKEMLPIIDIPTINLQVNEALEAGIEEIIFVINDKKDSIIKYFNNDTELEEFLIKNNKKELINKIKDISKNIKISYVKQEEALGSGDAIYRAKELIGNEAFAIMYGDDLIKGNSALKELIEIYNKYDANVIGIGEVPKELVSSYGIISFNEDLKLVDIVEKPSIEDAPSNFAGLGRYIIKPEIFGILENLQKGANGEYQFTDAMKELMNIQDFYCCKFSGTYYDIGSKLGYIKANIAYAIDSNMKEELLSYMEKVIKENR
ncbi:MAG TPA: UTP--glucose-1-phosphate uridylyltransferase [Bacilli bacterium]|nr:UTP--glucose-1-phosphate uridylyltransferase [Bacilli bacterium]